MLEAESEHEQITGAPRTRMYGRPIRRLEDASKPVTP
jgi:hypothetical protein